MDNKLVKSEVENYAKFNIIRYAQVWEDADILQEALDVNANDSVISIASAGENALSLLVRNPKHVYAIDLSDEQIFCCELKISAYKLLDYEECMELIGVKESINRKELYEKVVNNISNDAKEYFYNNFKIIENGIIHCGKFEKYLTTFGKKVLPLVHSKSTIQELLQPKTEEERIRFYDEKWNNRRWRLLFRIFFSKHVMAKLGRDEAFFRYVKTNVADNILEHTKYAITKLDNSQNSYLHYILNGKYTNVLPLAYRRENFDIIKNNIDKISLHSKTVEEFVQDPKIEPITKFNLSDIFEYMSDEQMQKIVEQIIKHSPKGTRLAYWNMLADKQASKYFDDLKLNEELSDDLWHKDKAFFYTKFLVEEII